MIHSTGNELNAIVATNSVYGKFSGVNMSDLSIRMKPIRKTINDPHPEQKIKLSIYDDANVGNIKFGRIIRQPFWNIRISLKKTLFVYGIRKITFCKSCGKDFHKSGEYTNYQDVCL